MIKPLEALAELDTAFDEFENEASFSRIQASRNRTMPARSHSSSSNGRRRFNAKKTNVKAGIRRRYNKKVLHSS